MNLPRVRFTVRRLMVWVAIVALFAGGAVASRRRAETFRRRAFSYIPLTHEETGPPRSMRRETREDRLNDYYRFMIRKYNFAAAFPLLPVWPDSPEPE